MNFFRKLFGNKKSENPSSTQSNFFLICAACSKSIQNYHYDFEHLLAGEVLGSQCSACGQVLCAEHTPPGTCTKCGGELVFLEAGPASSSMVEGAMRAGKYSPIIRPPYGKRNVENC